MKIKNLSIFFILFSLAIFGQDTSFIRPVIIDADMHQNGLLNEESLPKLIAKAFQDKPLIFPEFSSPACMSATNIKGEGGYNTKQLFALTSTCAGVSKSFIIKEPRNGLEEATRLNDIALYPGMASLTASKVEHDMPSLALPVAYLSYDGPSTKHYLLIMPQAVGKSLCTIINEYRSKELKPDIARIYHRLGFEMAHLQQRFMRNDDPKSVIGKTVVHGDLKCLNIFYDQKNNHFTLIDNESLQKSLKNPILPQIDNFRLLFGNFWQGEDYALSNILNGIDLKTWYEGTVRSFVEGYVESFPALKRWMVLMELKNLINPDMPPSFAIPRFAEIKAKYLDPIFDELKQKYPPISQ